MQNAESDNIDITNDIKKQFEVGGWNFTGKKRAGIYKIKNVKNGKYYLGSSNNITKRLLYYHYKSLMMNTHFNTHLQRTWNRYGENCFRFYVVKEIPSLSSDKDLLFEEQKWLDIMSKNRRKYYNQIFIAGKVEFTPAVRKKIGEATKKRIQKNGHPLLGTHPSQDTLRRMSIAQTGKKRSKTAIRKISGKRSVAHRPEVKTKKRNWWKQLRQDTAAYSDFCKQRAIKMAEKRYGNYTYAKNYEVVHN